MDQLKRRWRAAALSALLAGSVIFMVSAASSASAAANPECIGTYNNYSGAFAAYVVPCAEHATTPAVFYRPKFTVRLRSTVPYRFTRCVINYAYQTAQDGPVRRGALGCTSLVRFMISAPAFDWSADFCVVDGTVCAGSLDGVFYLKMWGHVTLTFDHTNFNTDDFHYISFQ